MTTEKNIIPEDVITEINLIPPEELAARGIVQLAKDRKSYCCPACPNGTGNSKGKKGNGITPKMHGGIWKWKCFSCGKKFNNIGILAIYYGLDTRADFVEICRRACDDFGIPLPNNDFAPNPARKVQPKTPAAPPMKEQPPKKMTQELQEVINADIKAARANWDKLSQENKFGITDATAEFWQLGAIFNWTPPKARLADDNPEKDTNKYYPSPRVIFPHLTNSALPNITLTYCAGLFMTERKRLDALKKDYRKYLYGGTRTPYGLQTLTPTAKEIFVTEGEKDCISLWQATGGKYPCLATGGTAENLIFDALADFYRNKKPVIYFFADNDKAGKDFVKNILDAARQAGFIVIIIYFADFNAEKVDANKILLEQGNDKLADIINEKIALAQIELERAADAQKTAEYCFKTVKGNSDLANARRLIYLQRDNLLYVSDADKFAFYSGKKRLWTIDGNKNSSVYPLIIDAAETLNNLAKTDVEKTIANTFTNHKKYSPVVSTLKGCREIIVTRADFDNYPNLLNCQNCAVDLQTGKIYEVSAEIAKLHLTQQTDANYLPNWKKNPAEIVEKFLRDILPNESIRNFFISWLGYCLTAEVNEEKFVIMQGGGGNGKGTLTNLLMQIGGSYFAPFPVQGILWKKYSDADAATTALSILDKARLAMAEEIPPSVKVDPAKLKLITGGDRIPIRKMFEEYSHIEPTAKLMLSGNNAPTFPDANDFGIQRRLIAVLFKQDFRKNPDLNLKKKLLEQSAKDYFLSMLIDAAQDWYKNGLKIPQILQETTKEYLAAQDFILEFLTEYCEYCPNSFIPRQEFVNKLREIYPRETPPNNQTLKEMLEKIEGVTYTRDLKGMVLKGIKWRN